jgi:hypothetical protein
MQAAKARGDLYFTRGELGIWPNVGRGRAEINVSRIDGVDGTDIKDMSLAQFEGRRQMVIDHALSTALNTGLPVCLHLANGAGSAVP